MSRRVFALDAVPVVAPRPTLAVSGDYFFTSSVVGWDVAADRLGDTPERQFALAFERLQQLVEQAGLALDDVGYLTVYLADPAHRPLINPPWLGLFPDAGNRPARKTTQHPLPADQVVQLQAFGRRGARRRPVELDGLAHRDPLPNGATLGDLMFSSVLGGQDPRTGNVAPDPDEQLARVFQNLRALLEAAGGSLADVLHAWVFLRDRSLQDALVREWLVAFPDDGDRPARKTIQRYPLQGDTAVQVQATAVLGHGARQNFEIAGIGHHDPIPMGARRGPLLFSSGVSGYDPRSGELVEGLAAQLEQSLRNVQTLVEQAGGSLADLVHVTVLVEDFAALPALDAAWRAAFGDPTTAPPRHVMPLGLPASAMHAQLHVIAALPDA